MPKYSVAHSLLKAINEQGLEKGIAHYESIKNDHAYHLDEHELNMVSYELLKADQGKSAIAVLELAIASFPNAFNLYDSHGEIFRKLGNEAAAIKSYKKSISINPKNDNDLKMLKELGVDIDKESLYLLKTDKCWTKEIFTFPLHFAKGLDYEGTEEAHFPKGCRDTESPEFWSYAFAWNINLTTKLSEAEMEDRIQIYFDDIMNVVNKQKDRILPKSIANLDQTDNGEDVSKFAGAIDVHDSFVTRESMRLYVQAESHYCERQKKAIILFRFSP